METKKLKGKTKSEELPNVGHDTWVEQTSELDKRFKPGELSASDASSDQDVEMLWTLEGIQTQIFRKRLNKNLETFMLGEGL